MLESLRLINFTAFAEADLRFCPGFNVIVGQNGTGKTHLLKAAYLINRAWPDLMLNRRVLSKQRVEEYFSERLLSLFQPVRLDNLRRRGATDASRIAGAVKAFIPTVFIGTQTEVSERLSHFPFGSLTEDLRWEIILEPAKEVSLGNTNANLNASQIPETAAVNSFVPKSLFIPSKEIVSLYEGLIALLDRYEIKLDGTYRDLASVMNAPELSNAPDFFSGVLADLENELGGTLQLEAGRLVFVASTGDKTEGPLMAEGFRKLTTLLYLIRHGALTQKGETLFWDEPEANLNPAYIRWVANALVWLASAGIQVVAATHSLFFLRELEILQSDRRYENLPIRYFALSLEPDGVKVSAGNDIAEVDPLILLDEDLAQSDRYFAATEK